MAYYEGSIADIGSGGNSNQGFGYGGDWVVIILFALIFGWGRGFGGYGNGGGETTINVDSAVQRGFDTASIQGKLNDIGNGLCDGFYAVNTSMLNGFNGINMGVMQNGYETRSAISTLGYNLQDCCCQLNNNITMQSNAMQQALCNSTRDIIDSQREGTNAILSYLTNEKITSLNRELSLAQGQLSQAQQTTNIINALKPCPQPAYVVPNPNCCYGVYNGCGTSIQ